MKFSYNILKIVIKAKFQVSKIYFSHTGSFKYSSCLKNIFFLTLPAEIHTKLYTSTSFSTSINTFSHSGKIDKIQEQMGFWKNIRKNQEICGKDTSILLIELFIAYTSIIHKRFIKCNGSYKFIEFSKRTFV